MGSLVELLCDCGGSQHVPAERVQAGRLPPCRDCGGALHAGAPSPAEAEPPASAAPLSPLAPTGVTAARADADSMRCPACGGPCKTVFRGPDGSDRMLACGYCGTKVDLPEARGFTRERVTERPNERIVERVTEWESLGPQGEPSVPSLPDLGSAVERFSVGESFELNGQHFDSFEALEKRLREVLPEDAVDDILAKVSESASAGGGVRTRVKLYESTRVTGGAPQGRRKARKRAPAKGLLAKLRKLFG